MMQDLGPDKPKRPESTVEDLPLHGAIHDDPEARSRIDKAERRKRLVRELLTDLAFLSPQLLVYVGLVFVPFLFALPIVFTDQLDFLDVDIEFVGLANFTSVFEEPLRPRFLAALQRSTIFTLLNYVMVFVFGLGLALSMFELISRFKNTFFVIIYMPWMISGIGLGFMLVMLFSKDTGSFNLLLEELGFGRNLINIKSEAAATFFLPFVIGWKAAGFNMALFLGGLLSIPKQTIESARLDGAPYFRRVFEVYLPQMVPSLIIATIYALLGSFGLFDPLVGLGALYGNQNAEFLSVLIYKVGFGSGTMGGMMVGTLAEGIAITMIVFGPLTVVAFYLNRLQKRLQYN